MLGCSAEPRGQRRKGGGRKTMSIFSLQTKKHLVGWGVGLGMILFIGTSFYFSSAIKYIGGTVEHSRVQSGFPFKFVAFDKSICDVVDGCEPYIINPRQYEFMGIGEIQNKGNLLIDLLFWFLVSLIILSLIRHFKSKPA